MSKTVLITGMAGFIGAFLAKRVLETTDYRVVGFDNCNDYYDPGIKENRLKMLYSAVKGDEEQIPADLMNGFECDRLVLRTVIWRTRMPLMLCLRSIALKSS